MTITLELSIDQQRQLQESRERQDGNAMRQILLLALDSVIEKLLGQAKIKSAEIDFEALADQLARDFAATTPAEHRPLAEHATTREGIYGEHP